MSRRSVKEAYIEAGMEMLDEANIQDEETITVDEETGGRKGSKLARFDLLPWAELWEVAELYGRGAEKYEERNWELGYKWSLSFAALQRHLTQFWNGEDYDSETGAHHLTSVVFHALALLYFRNNKKGTDDRPPIEAVNHERIELTDDRPE